MPEEDRSSAPRPAQADHAERQGLGIDRPARVPQSQLPGAGLDDRNAAGLGEGGGDLGASTAPNVDVHDLGQEDVPEQDWGEEMGEDAMFSSDHARRPVRTEAERGQGPKTRRRHKDIVSRRS